MAGQRIYRTVDGRHVEEGHVDAAFLAYSQYDDVPDDVLADLGKKPAPKQAAKSADKSRRPSRNKSADTASSDD